MTPELAITCFYHPSLFSYSFILLSYLFMILPSPILKLWELWTCSSIEQGFMDSFTDFHPEKWHAFLWNVPFHIMLIRFCWFIETLAHLSEPRSTHWKARSYSIARSLGVQSFQYNFDAWIDTRRAQQRHCHTAWAPEHAKKFSSSPRSRNNPKIGLEKRRSYTTDSTGIVGHRCFGSLALRCHWRLPQTLEREGNWIDAVGMPKKKSGYRWRCLFRCSFNSWNQNRRWIIVSIQGIHV